MYTVRPAGAGDVDELVRLRLDFVREASGLRDEDVAALAGPTRGHFERCIEERSLFVWVAEEDGVITATSGLIVHEGPPLPANLSGRQGYVINMYTLPEHRGRGIASTLLERILAFAEENGLGRLWLLATEDGRGVYERAGFGPGRLTYMQRGR